MGGAPGEAYANALKFTGMRPEHVLAPESIQNSVDARASDKVRVRFGHVKIARARKADFIAAAGLKDLAARAGQLELTGTHCLSTLDSPTAPLSL